MKLPTQVTSLRVKDTITHDDTLSELEMNCAHGHLSVFQTFVVNLVTSPSASDTTANLVTELSAVDTHPTCMQGSR